MAKRTTRAAKAAKLLSMMDFIEKGLAVRRSLKISELTIDPKFQARVETSVEHVRRIVGIIENTGVIEPVCVFFDKETGKYYLWDGFHRVAAHIALGQTQIVAWVADGSEDDAMLYSCSANIGQSTLMSPTLADKRKAAKNLLLSKTGCTWPGSKVSKQCGLSERAVARIVNQMTESEKKTCEYMVYQDTNGETYKTKRALARISKSPALRLTTRGNYRFKFRGVEYDTKQKCKDTAASVRDEIVDGVLRAETALIRLDYSFSEDMAKRGVWTDSADNGTIGRICGVRSQPGVVFSVCRSYSAKEYLAAIGSLVVTEPPESSGPNPRRIVFARSSGIAGDSQVHRLSSRAAELGIETMTPEEYIKEVEMERYFAAKKQSPAEVA